MTLYLQTLRVSASPREEFFGSCRDAETRGGIALWL
jgi:hypothetical protein